MTNTQPERSSGPFGDVTDAVSGRDPAKSAFLIYILYLVGIAVPVLPLVGVVLAYLFRGQAQGWLATHYVYIVRTFWIGLAYSLVALLLMVLMIGWLIYLAIVVWLVVRCVKGMQLLSRRAPVPDPQTWAV